MSSSPSWVQNLLTESNKETNQQRNKQEKHFCTGEEAESNVTRDLKINYLYIYIHRNIEQPLPLFSDLFKSVAG